MLYTCSAIYGPWIAFYKSNSLQDEFLMSTDVSLGVTTGNLDLFVCVLCNHNQFTGILITKIFWYKEKSIDLIDN